ncbi:MAG: hypothetical protein KIT60_03615 [Burkholderiaceae bacterium]|nr:hypothetical protein [Burkholderiaceae bacterium]
MGQDLEGASSDPQCAERASAALEVRYRSEAPFPNRHVRFPCDRDGRVDIDALNDACRRDCLFARVLERLGYAQSQIVRVSIPA